MVTFLPQGFGLAYAVASDEGGVEVAWSDDDCREVVYSETESGGNSEGSSGNWDIESSGTCGNAVLRDVPCITRQRTLPDGSSEALRTIGIDSGTSAQIALSTA